MKFIQINVLLIFLVIHYSQSLRCRSGNQQTGEEIRKVMQTCKQRYSDNKNGDDSSSSNYSNESDEDDSSDDGSLFERDVFPGSKKNEDNNNNNTNNNNNYNNNNQAHYMGNRQSRNYRSQLNRGDDTRSRYGNTMNNSTGNRNMRNRDSRYGAQYDNNSRNSNDDEQQSCIVQCFFDELNLVDRRGFPERIAVTAMMTRGVQNPTLRDFIEESIFECFHFLLSTMNSEKCEFSQNLLNCLADKGRESCEDWSD